MSGWYPRGLIFHQQRYRPKIERYLIQNLLLPHLLSHFIKDACVPGTWSPDGIPPCAYCSKGRYQDSFGAIECNVCPGALTTDVDGASNAKDCLGMITFQCM
jgi:hypothetical protein